MFKKILAPLAILMATLLLHVGCGSGETIQEDPAPFAKAITAYLQRNSMDLKVDRFRELKVTGDTAEAGVSLAYAGDGVGVKVRWQFTFQKQDGQWTVTSHKD